MTAVSERWAIGDILSAWTTTDVVLPNDPKYTPIAGRPYVRATLRQGDAFQVEIGSPMVIHRYPGLLILQVFSPVGEADKPVKLLADALAALFRRAKRSFTDGSITFRTPAVRDVGESGAFYQVNVTVPFVRDHMS